MFPFLTGLRSIASAEWVLILDVFKLDLVVLELSFKAEVRADRRPSIPEEGDGLPEPPLIFFHEVGDD